MHFSSLYLASIRVSERSTLLSICIITLHIDATHTHTYVALLIDIDALGIYFLTFTRTHWPFLAFCAQKVLPLCTRKSSETQLRLWRLLA